jgi:hypothetical protein
MRAPDAVATTARNDRIAPLNTLRETECPKPPPQFVRYGRDRLDAIRTTLVSVYAEV